MVQLQMAQPGWKVARGQVLHHQQLHLISPSSGFLRPVVKLFQAEREAMAV
jgi:hypothetical protein